MHASCDAVHLWKAAVADDSAAYNDVCAAGDSFDIESEMSSATSHGSFMSVVRAAKLAADQVRLEARPQLFESQTCFEATAGQQCQCLDMHAISCCSRLACTSKSSWQVNIWPLICNAALNPNLGINQLRTRQLQLSCTFCRHVIHCLCQELGHRSTAEHFCQS